MILYFEVFLAVANSIYGTARRSCTRALRPAAAAGGRGRPAPYSPVIGDARVLVSRQGW